MKTTQRITCLLLLLLGTHLFAQTGVKVTYYDGTEQQFNVQPAGKLYFDADNLFVKADAGTTPTTIPVSIIRKVTFSEALGTTTFGQNTDNLVLYPNPASESIRIKSDTSTELKTSIYSLTGQRILQGVFQSGQDIDVSALSAGLYLVQVNGVTIKFSKK
ncbi:T9SS type A sorting domain-containing protein [Flavobacterium silvaticum]|uniref:T9SS type A sorting domain-containing protein n=1 Tax=Flavobacterium silvaticum TaxID=1852020 RepID=A0A972FNN5_9FLAO|nr:T9SS type A sorting domain-containing protein [Flavobacterium silvaticum]NMH26584.1 T9SS type A sorting domain-containing protein [Flavobacterium silvaticum]